MPEINPLTNNQIFLKKIAENTGSVYDTGDVSEINPLTIDQIFLKEIAANTAGQSGDITELKGKVADNTGAIEAIENITGAKNFLPYPYLYTTHTTNGITFTDNGDGTITVNGVATDNARFWFRNFSSMSLGSGNYIFSCLPDNQSSKYVFTIGYKTSSDSEDVYIMGTTKEGITVNIPSGTYEDNKCKIVFCFDVLQGADLTTPVTFKPMIRDARITDPTYVPYAMTNRELTVAVNRGSVSVTADGVKTWTQLLQSLTTVVDFSKITPLNSKLVYYNGVENIIAPLESYHKNNSYYCYQNTASSNANGPIIETYQIGNGYEYRGSAYSGAEHDISSQVVTSGNYLTLYY